MVDDSNPSHAPDIGRQELGGIYAKAFLGASEKAGVTDEVMAEFDAVIHEVLDRFPGLEATLASLRVSPKEKASVLDAVFGARVSENLMAFLKIVCAHNRLDCLREIHTEARRQRNQQRGIVDVHVTTAEPVSTQHAGKIALALSKALGQEVQVHERTNAALIGGMVVRVGDRVFDGSVANGLARLRAETLERTIQEMRDAGERFVVAD